MQDSQIQICGTLDGVTVDLLPFGWCTVYLAGTPTKAALFDNLGGSIANPVQANSSAVVRFSVADGLYDYQIQDATGGYTAPRLYNQQIYDLSNLGSSSVATRTALAAVIGPTNNMTRYLTESGYEGPFAFSTNNLATRVSADPGAINYVPPTGQSGSSGAWVRRTDAMLQPYKASRVVDVLFVYGQSNAKGHATSTAGAPTKLSPLARVWSGGAFIQLTPYTPTAADGTSTGSAWAAFANEYCGITGRELVIINGAKDSQSVAQLQKGLAPYTAAATFLTNALAALVAEGSTVGNKMAAYWQGEQDAVLATTYATYSTSLAQLWTDLKADFSFTALGIVTVGYYATSDMLHGQTIQEAQRLFARGNADVFIAYDRVGGYGLHNLLKVPADTVHLNQRGQNIVGREAAKRFTEVVFPDNLAPATDQHIQRFGSLGMNQSQAWNLHAAMLQKSTVEPGWSVNHTSPRASSLIKSVDASVATVLNVELTCPARTIMFAQAQFHGPLAAAKVRASVHNNLATTATWPPPNANGVTVVPLYFYCDLHLRLQMGAGTWDNALMSTALASLKDGVTVTFNSTGVVTINHPAIIGFPTGTIQGTAPTARTLAVNGTSTQTIVHLYDASNALVNDTIAVVLPNMLVAHGDIPTTAELSFLMVAADYAVW